MFGFSNVFPTTTAGGGGAAVLPTFKILCKADGNSCLTVRDGGAVLAPADSSDEHQHWFKDKRFATFVKDEEGKPAFALINKATGLALQHFGNVKLVPYDPHYLDESVLWSKSGDMTEDFHYIRMVDEIYLNLNICDEGHHDKHHSGVQDGTKVVLSNWCKGDNQYWRMIPWSCLLS
ncbi:unnamed protein product [Urochloa decumbens]|uniref:Uncharacterized protein n=1 Tax=Urochloa decumbens TaxID=240449 RepID=A0ABC8WW87_9POAL